MGSTEHTQLLTFKEISTHNKKSDCWLIISSKVYDVTPFLDDHPGGDQILLKATGKDATDDFYDLNHSEEATGMLNSYYIGDLDSSTLPGKKKYKSNSVNKKLTSTSKSLGIFQFSATILIIALAYSIYHIYKKDWALDIRVGASGISF